MNRLLRRCAILLMGSMFSAVAFAGGPTHEVKLVLKFDGSPDCYLQEKGAKGSKEQAKGMIKHDEDTISWTASCVVKLPASVQYCSLTSQSVKTPGDFVYYSSEAKKGAVVAKIISDADINPEFAEFSASYLCF